MQEESKPQPSAKLAEANLIIRNHAIGSAVVGIVPLPIPLIDMGLLAGLQLNLIRSLAAHYNMPFSDEVGKALISAIIGSTVPGMGWGIMRNVPPAGLVGASALGAAMTYALGKVFVQHFESGGTFLNLDPDEVRDYYTEEVHNGHAGLKSDGTEEDYAGIKP